MAPDRPGSKVGRRNRLQVSCVPYLHQGERGDYPSGKKTRGGCDLSFENSTVEATVKGHVDSIKSPASGRIEVDSVGEIVYERAPVDGHGCEIITREGYAPSGPSAEG